MVQATKTANVNPTDPRSMMEALQAPFPLEDLEWRVQRVVKTAKGYKAIVVTYVSNRAIQKRLDDLFSPFGWKNEFREWRQKGVLCGISILWGDQWITKFDGADETDIEGTKGGFSGSQKRAAVEWGIGRYLYSLDEVWVDVKSQGQNYVKSKVKVDGKEEWITGYWDTPQLPDWALPTKSNLKSSQTNTPSTDQATNKQETGKIIEMPTKDPLLFDCQLVAIRYGVSQDQKHYAEVVFRRGDREVPFFAIDAVYDTISGMDLAEGANYRVVSEKSEKGIYFIKELYPLEG